MSWNDGREGTREAEQKKAGQRGESECLKQRGCWEDNQVQDSIGREGKRIRKLGKGIGEKEDISCRTGRRRW